MSRGEAGKATRAFPSMHRGLPVQAVAFRRSAADTCSRAVIDATVPPARHIPSRIASCVQYIWPITKKRITR